MRRSWCKKEKRVCLNCVLSTTILLVLFDGNTPPVVVALKIIKKVAAKLTSVAAMPAREERALNLL